MANEQVLRKILAEKYGIHTDKELDEAIRNMEKLSIGWAFARNVDDDTGSQKPRRRENKNSPV